MKVGRIEAVYSEILDCAEGFVTVEADGPGPDGEIAVYALIPVLPGAREKAEALGAMIAEYLTPRTEVV